MNEQWKLCCFKKDTKSTYRENWVKFLNGEKINAEKPMTYADWVYAGIILMIVVPLTIAVLQCTQGG